MRLHLCTFGCISNSHQNPSSNANIKAMPNPSSFDLQVRTSEKTGISTNLILRRQRRTLGKVFANTQFAFSTDIIAHHHFNTFAMQDCKNIEIQNSDCSITRYNITTTSKIADVKCQLHLLPLTILVCSD